MTGDLVVCEAMFEVSWGSASNKKSFTPPHTPARHGMDRIRLMVFVIGIESFDVILLIVQMRPYSCGAL